MRILGFLLALALCAPASAHGAGAAEATLSEASMALSQGQYAQAIVLASSALAEPGLDDLARARLLVVQGLAQQAQGSNDSALAEFTRALSLPALPDRERARALFARGVSLDSLGRLDDALGDYGAVLKLAPNASYALNNRANVYRRQGRMEEARRDYLAALAGANPNPQYPFYGLGQIAESAGDAETARSFYQKTLVADPGFELARERLRALGTVADGAAGIASETGTIVLRPPVARAAVSPAIADERGVPAVPARPPHPQAVIGSTQLETSLRPAIVEGNASASLVQLGAWRSEAEAAAGWLAARERAGGMLDGLTPLILRTDVPKRGTFFRLRVSARGSPALFCVELRKTGVDCVVAFS